MTCHVSGVLYAPDETPLPETKVVVVPADGIVASDGGAIMPEILRFETDQAGLLEMDLAPGRYHLYWIGAESKGRSPLAVPDEASANLADLLFEADVPIRGNVGPIGKGWDRVYYDPVTDDLVFESDEYPELNYRTPALAGPRQAAQDWAEGSGEPGGPGTKSSKTWAGEAEQSAGQASSSASAAEDHKDDAETAAQQASDDADAAAADRVATGQDRQQTGLDRQQTGQDRQAAETAKGAAEDARDAAQGFAGDAEDARDAAQGFAGGAEDARDLAEKWANDPEDQAVEGGEYSAKHYAAKAGKSAADAEDTKAGLLDDLTVDATTLAPGAPATASWDGNAQKVTFGIPEGQPGDIDDAVRWDQPQSLSGSEQQQARDNMALGDLATKDKAAITSDTTGTLPVNRGGTGATAAAAARTNLGVGTAGTRADSYFVQKAADLATQTQAEAGADNTKYMTPLRVKQAIDEMAGGGGSPPGAIVYFAMSAAPDGWLKANGAAISRTTYADLFAAIGTTFGAGNGSTTFNLPDLRGEFIRGWDDGRGVDSGRAFGSPQADELKSHRHLLTIARGGSGSTGGNTWNHSEGRNENPIYGGYTGGSETRPRNVALLPCIKY